MYRAEPAAVRPDGVGAGPTQRTGRGRRGRSTFRYASALAMRLALVLVLAAAPTAHAQLAVGLDVSAGPSLTALGASGRVEAAGLNVPLGRVDFPTSVGVDARVRADVHGPTWGGRVGVGLLTASDVFDGASLFGERSIDVAFAVASAELTYRQPAYGAEVVAGLGPEVRVVLDQGDPDAGLRRLLGDVRESHLAVGASLGARFDVGGVTLGPEIRGGLALTPLSDDAVTVFEGTPLAGTVRLAGDFRFDHVSVGLTVGI